MFNKGPSTGILSTLSALLTLSPEEVQNVLCQRGKGDDEKVLLKLPTDNQDVLKCCGEEAADAVCPVIGW